MLQRLVIIFPLLKALSNSISGLVASEEVRHSTARLVNDESSCNTKNDQIKEISCPCDISFGLCDADCCGDLGCSQAELESSSHKCGGGGCERIQMLESKNNHDRKRRLDIQDKEIKRAGTVQGRKFNCAKNRRRDNLLNHTYNFDFQRLADYVEDEMDQLLCVHYDNSAVQGTSFHHEEDELTSKAIVRKTKLNDFNFENDGNHFYLDDFEQSAYSDGDHIDARLELHSSEFPMTYTIGSKLSLPGAGDNGLCSFDNALLFGVNMKSSCWVVLDDLESRCNHDLNIDRFIDKIAVSKMRGQTFTSIAEDSDALVMVEVDTIKSQNGQEIINLTSPYTMWENDLSHCKHSLQGLKYEIYHDSNSISKAKAKIVWTNIRSHTKLLKQYFEVLFILTSVQEETPSNGSSGYHFHAPIMAGVSDNEKVKTSNKAFAIMKSGSCINQRKSMLLGFGEDISVTCTASFNKNALEDVCVSLNHDYLTTGGLNDQLYAPKWFLQEHDMIGIFADANPNKVEDWIKIKSDVENSDFIGKSRVWNPFQKKCEGMVTAIRYRFYWTYSGQLDSPQAKILQITKEHDSDTPLIHRYHDDYEQNFRFITTVSWTFVEPKKRVERLLLPSILFSVPDDVFYPFQTRSSQGKALPSLLAVLFTFIAYALSESI